MIYGLFMAYMFRYVWQIWTKDGLFVYRFGFIFEFSRILYDFVGNNAKGRISKWVYQQNKAGQIFRKKNIYQEVRKFVFRKIWPALFSLNTRCEICSFALLPMTLSHKWSCKEGFAQTLLKNTHDETLFFPPSSKKLWHRIQQFYICFIGSFFILPEYFVFFPI